MKAKEKRLTLKNTKIELINFMAVKMADISENF